MGGKKGNKSKSKSRLRGKERLQALGRAPKTIGKKEKTVSIYPGTTGIGPVADGQAYAKALSKAKNQPSKKTTGVGPVISGKEYASMLKKSPPVFSGGTMEQQKAALRDGTGSKDVAFINFNKIKESPANTPLGDGMIKDSLNQMQKNLKQKYDTMRDSGIMSDQEYNKNMKRLLGDQFKDQSSLNTGTLTATHDNRLFKSVPATGPAADTPASDAYKDGMLQKNLTPSSPGNIFGVKLAAAGDLTGIGVKSTPNYFSIKSPESFGYPSQDAVDKAAGITAGGLNIGGSGFTPTNFNDPTARVADAYKSTLNPNSFKGLSDGSTFGSGPVASGEDYARGLNVGYDNVENVMRRFVENRLPVVDALPGVNTRRLTDKEIADKRVKAEKMRKEMMQGRKVGSGGAKPLAAIPTVIEELLPEAVPVPSASTTPTTQTGVDPNRLLQIQQQAYAQAYNPMLIGGFNPQFRFGAATPTIDYSTYFNY